MIKPIEFLNALKKAKIQFVTGVPDSLLKEICACIDKNFSKKNLQKLFAGSLSNPRGHTPCVTGTIKKK